MKINKIISKLTSITIYSICSQTQSIHLLVDTNWRIFIQIWNKNIRYIPNNHHRKINCKIKKWLIKNNLFTKNIKNPVNHCKNITFKNKRILKKNIIVLKKFQQTKQIRKFKI